MVSVWLRLAAICVGLLALPGVAHAAPSFSCADANSPLDKLICADAGLAAMDTTLAEAFRDAHGNADLLTDQRRWLAARAISCPDVAVTVPTDSVVRRNAIDCVMELYEQRVAQLLQAHNAAAWPHLPFTPTLIEGAGTKLCEALQSDITATFLGSSVDPDPLGTRVIGFTTIAGQAEGTDMRRAEFDPYNSGKPVAVLLEIDDGGMHLDVASYRRFATPAALDRALAALRRVPNTSLDEISARMFNTEAMQDNPGNRMAQPLPNFVTESPVVVPAMPQFFRADGVVYVYAPLAPPNSSGLAGVYRIVNPRLAQRVCLFRTDPKPDMKRYEDVTGKAGLSDLVAAAAPLLPHGMACWSVSKAFRTHADAALWRPWALASWPRLPGETETETFARYMRNRGLTGLERNRQYRDYTVARTKTIASFAQYFVDEFARGNAEAGALATLWTDLELNEDAELDPGEAESGAMLAADFVTTHKAAAAALAGDAAALQAALGDDAKAAVARARGAYDETLATDALEHLELLRRLLDMGFDPDEFGASGRTALMTAARLDLVDAASLLLDRGAKVDLGTGDAVAEPYPEGDVLCSRAGTPPEGDTPGRTALSYAAEAGSPAMVRLLLAHGADPSAADSDGKSPASRAADEVRSLLAPAR
jgi:uncharacterized protein